jgi:hypothetical protein
VLKARVESLLSAANSQCDWSDDLAKWTSTIPDALAAKLAKVGLTPPRKTGESPARSDTSGGFPDSYIAKRNITKENTARNYETTRRLLIFPELRQYLDEVFHYQNQAPGTSSPATVRRTPTCEPNLNGLSGGQG